MSSSLKLIASTGMNAVLQELLPLYEAQVDRSVSVSYDSSALILERLESGEAADAIVLTRGALEALAQRGIVIAKSLTNLAKSGVGIIVKSGAQHPDITTETSCWDAVKAKAITQPGGRIAGLVSSGKAEIGVQLESELVGMPGVEYVGPLPAALQMEIIFSAGIFSSSAKSALAEELIQFLCKPEYAAVYRKNGMGSLG